MSLGGAKGQPVELFALDSIRWQQEIVILWDNFYLSQRFFSLGNKTFFFYNFVIFQISIRPNCEIANNFIELLSQSLN